MTLCHSFFLKRSLNLKLKVTQKSQFHDILHRNKLKYVSITLKFIGHETHNPLVEILSHFNRFIN